MYPQWLVINSLISGEVEHLSLPNFSFYQLWVHRWVKPGQWVGRFVRKCLHQSVPASLSPSLQADLTSLLLVLRWEAKFPTDGIMFIMLNNFPPHTPNKIKLVHPREWHIFHSSWFRFSWFCKWVGVFWESYGGRGVPNCHIAKTEQMPASSAESEFCLAWLILAAAQDPSPAPSTAPLRPSAVIRRDA